MENRFLLRKTLHRIPKQWVRHDGVSPLSNTNSNTPTYNVFFLILLQSSSVAQVHRDIPAIGLPKVCLTPSWCTVQWTSDWSGCTTGLKKKKTTSGASCALRAAINPLTCGGKDIHQTLCTEKVPTGADLENRKVVYLKHDPSFIQPLFHPHRPLRRILIYNGVKPQNS